jgi:hypothetical protein
MARQQGLSRHDSSDPDALVNPREMEMPTSSFDTDVYFIQGLLALPYNDDDDLLSNDDELDAEDADYEGNR